MKHSNPVGLTFTQVRETLQEVERATKAACTAKYHDVVPKDSEDDLAAVNEPMFHSYWNLNEDHEREYAQLKAKGLVR